MSKLRKVGLYAASVATMVGMTALVAMATTTVSDTQVTTDATRATGATGSFQNLAGDLTYQGGAGGTSAYHAGVMGNFLGDTLTNATSAYHAGVIGSYNVTTSDALTGAKAGVVGEAGTDIADAAIMAVLGGDTGTLTPTAAYGVQYFNSTAASKFDYGLDLFHAATTDYGAVSAVDYGTADIRLQNGETISNATDGTIDFGTANLALVSSAVTRATGATGSFQPIAGDLTYQGGAGGTSAYHAGVMGNFLGDTLTNATSAYHAGVIGSYNVTTSDALTGAKAGVVGEAGTDVADAAVMAVLGGDTGTLTPTAAYGVQYFNSTAASKFDYGLDLFHAATTDYGAPSAVDYGTADIRLSTGVKISTGLIAAIPATCTAGDIYIATDGGDDGIIRACEATNDWDSVGTPAD